MIFQDRREPALQRLVLVAVRHRGYIKELGAVVRVESCFEITQIKAVIGDIEESAINQGGVDGSWLAITLGLVGGPLRRQGEEHVVNAVAVHISGSADAPQGEDRGFWRRCNPDGALWIEVIIVAVAVEITK